MWRTMFNRLKEPSTMAGIGVLLALFGVPHADVVVTGATQIIGGVVGLLAVTLPEKVGN